MADHQQNHYGAFEGGVGRCGSGDSYQDMHPMTTSSLGTHEPPHTAPMPSPQQHPHSQQQALYQMGVVGGLHPGANNPQFPPQNLYIPPISQHGNGNIMAAQTTGYVGQGLIPGTPVYTSAALGLAHHHAPHPMMTTAGAMMPGIYYQRPLMVRSGGSPPTSGGSPSPGSDDSDDSTPMAQGGRGKRPSPEAPVEPVAPAKGKKARVSKKSKKKKDPNEPQKPVSAYALFFRDTQAAIKGQNPNASFGEVSKIVASMWDSLDADNKSVYKKKTEAAKKEYLKALAAYRASLVSQGEGDPMFSVQNQAYGPFGANPAYGFQPNASAGAIPPGHSSPQLSPLAKKSPLLSSLMTSEAGQQQQQQALMNPPMSQPMPPSAPPMMTSHGPVPNMNPSNLGPHSGQPGPPQVSSQQHLSHMTSVPPTSPYMTQPNNPSLGSPVSSMGSDVGSPVTHSVHKVVQQTPNQQQSQQQPTHQQTTVHPQQISPQHQGQAHPLHQQHGSNQAGGSGGGHPVQGPNGGTPPCNSGSCIRSGCTNPAVHNPEWEDEYCSNECVVSHCRKHQSYLSAINYLANFGVLCKGYKVDFQEKAGQV